MVACVAIESGYKTGFSLAFDAGVLFPRPNIRWQLEYQTYGQMFSRFVAYQRHDVLNLPISLILMRTFADKFDTQAAEQIIIIII